MRGSNSSVLVSAADLCKCSTHRLALLYEMDTTAVSPRSAACILSASYHPSSTADSAVDCMAAAARTAHHSAASVQLLFILGMPHHLDAVSATIPLLCTLQHPNDRRRL